MEHSWHSEAVEIAWKMHRLSFRTEEAALRSLKRRCPGIGNVAPELLASAREVLLAVIKDVKEELTTFRKYPEMPGGISRHEQLVQSRVELSKKFPTWPASAREHALARAFIYNVL